MLDFIKSYVKVKPSKPKLAVATVKYNHINGMFCLVRRGKCYRVDGYDFSKSTTLYSLPSNSQYDSWTKKSKQIIEPTMHMKVSRSWAILKPNMKVKGTIINNEFVIKQY